MTYRLEFTQVMDADRRITVTYTEGLPPKALVEHFDGEEELYLGEREWDRFHERHTLPFVQRESASIEQVRLHSAIMAIANMRAEENLRAEEER